MGKGSAVFETLSDIHPSTTPSTYPDRFCGWAIVARWCPAGMDLLGTYGLQTRWLSTPHLRSVWVSHSHATKLPLTAQRVWPSYDLVEHGCSCSVERRHSSKLCPILFDLNSNVKLNTLHCVTRKNSRTVSNEHGHSSAPPSNSDRSSWWSTWTDIIVLDKNHTRRVSFFSRPNIELYIVYGPITSSWFPVAGICVYWKPEFGMEASYTCKTCTPALRTA